jgi:hypothetical protein
MNEHDRFLNQYLLARAREGDTILFQPPSGFRCAAVPGPAGLVAGTLVRWNRMALTLHVLSNIQGYQ